MTRAEEGGGRSFIAVRIAVMTVSDSRSLATDTSGDILKSRLEEAGHKLADRALVKDDIPAIRRCLRQWQTFT